MKKSLELPGLLPYMGIKTPLRMDYRNYSSSDFASDTFFIAWVRKPDPGSEQFWTEFLMKNPECRPAVDEARELVASMRFTTDRLDDSDFNRMRSRLLGALQAGKAEAYETSEVPRGRSLHPEPRRTWTRHMAAAAVLIAFFTSGIFLVTRNSVRPDPHIVFEKDNTEKKVTPANEKSVMFLADGTKVWLNGDSKLSYAKDFGTGNSRDVFLEGEAFFDVAHDAGKPFVVHTSAIRIKVLGTSFNVKSYSRDETIETTLVEGRVRIEEADEKGDQAEQVVLAPNQLAVFNKESRMIRITQVAPASSGSWRRERLTFREERMGNVITQVEKWYGVKINMQKASDLHCKLTATIEGETLQEFLQMLKVTHSIDYTISGEHVFITGALCK